MQFYFILVSPQLAENIGAAARAMNTMGFDNLRLVSPCDHLEERARWVAYGSNHILENATTYPSFDAAVADLDFIVGATARRRGSRREYFSGAELPELLLKKKSTIRNIGIAFGREDCGLLNEQISRCDALVALPMRASYPSLNLAQAVMVFAYILSPLVLQPATKPSALPAEGEFKALQSRLRALFTDIGLDANPNITNRLMERLAHLTEEDVHMLHSLCTKLERKIRPPATV